MSAYRDYLMYVRGDRRVHARVMRALRRRRPEVVVGRCRRLDDRWLRVEFAATPDGLRMVYLEFKFGGESVWLRRGRGAGLERFGSGSPSPPEVRAAAAAQRPA